MATPIEIGIASETKAFRQGVQAGIIEPLEDAADALDDLGKSKGPDKLERELEQAQKATKNLGRQVDRTADDIEKEFKDTYRKVEKSADDGMEGSADAVQEFKDETRQNLSEVVSSFDGDMSSIQDLAQGTFGGLANSLTGPLGIAAAGAAVGIGVIGSAIEGLEETAAATRERVAEHFRGMAASGIEEWSNAQAVIERMTDAYADHGDEIKAISDEIGVPAEVVAQAWAGVPEAMDLVLQKMQEAREKAVSLVSGDMLKGAEEMRFDRIVQPLKDAIGEIDAASEKYKEFSAWTDSYLRDVAAAAGTATQEVDELGNKLLTLEDGTQILIEADTGLATQRLDRFKGDLDDVPETVNTKVLFDVDDSAVKRALDNAKKAAKIRLEVTNNYGRNI